MRHLRKSAPPIGETAAMRQAVYLNPWVHNTSTKPYARFMHSLASLAYGEGEPHIFKWGKRDNALHPNRAERRAGLQVRFPNCAARRKMNRDIKFLRPVVLATPSDPAAPRKITGAVRRGLASGRVA